jgi:integrase
LAQLQVKVNVAGEISKGPDPQTDHADVLAGFRDSSLEKRLDDLSLAGREDVASHFSSQSTILEKALNKPFHYNRECRVCVSEDEAKNLAEVESRIEKRAAGATTLILEYAWKAKKCGLAELTIKQRVYRLRLLVKRGANLTDPDSVSTVLAMSSWSEPNKQAFIIAYKSFAKTFNLPWEPPKTRVQRKLPFIPTETEIDQLIAGCGKKTATFLQVLKETGARGCEVSKLRWADVDEKSCTITINNPAKGSLPRVIKVSPKTIAMIKALSKTRDFIFNPNVATIRKGFMKQRKRIAKTLQNPRLKQIHFHTFRHWKATIEYHRTKDILHVKQLLGHAQLKNTELYTHLINFESDEWHVAHAKNLQEEDKLIQAGFEYVRYSQEYGVAIYRKRK